MSDVIKKSSELIRSVKCYIEDSEDWEFPAELWFHKGMEFPKFKVTIEMIETDTFVDSSGQKWKKVD